MRVWIAATVFAVGFYVSAATPALGQSADSGESHQRGDVFRTKQGRFVDANGAGDARFIPAAPAASVSSSKPFTEVARSASEPVAAAPIPAQAPLTSATTYSVSRSDRTLRETLVKWARLSGWTFEPEHWAVGRDIPVAGIASVDTDFKTAARMLLRSTELTDLPVQPCFYNANKTLRVVPINDSCTRGN